MNKLFVFDLDDTLMDNVHDYAKPILDAAWFIVQTLGSRAPHVSKIIAMEQELDLRRINEINPDTGKPYLYSMERFPGSLVETYNEICRQANVVVRKRTQQDLYGIGLNAFAKEMHFQNIKPHAQAVVKFLYNQHDHLILCTKGDERVQKNKIAALSYAGIHAFFSDTIIVDQKTPDLFARLATRYSGVCYSVGNSYDSDIAPALAAPGFRGILIPVETWESIGKMDETKTRLDTDKVVHVLDNLAQIIDIYPRL